MSDLPLVYSEEPIIAHKEVILKIWNGEPKVAGAFQSNRLFDLERGQADCMSYSARMPFIEEINKHRARLGLEPRYVHSSTAPDEKCQCGFYSFKNSNDIIFPEGGGLATVKLYGRIIEHELGYRSQYQDIVKVEYSRLTHNHCHHRSHATETLNTAKTQSVFGLDITDRLGWWCQSHIETELSAEAASEFFGVEIIVNEKPKLKRWMKESSKERTKSRWGPLYWLAAWWTMWTLVTIYPSWRFW